VDFFKNDDGEYLPRSARGANGLEGREYHNVYGFYYGRAIYAGMEGLDDRRGFIYARSAWVGSQRFPALFLGDQKPTFEHMASTLRAGLNLGLLGFAHWTPDVFGLDGKVTPEMHHRYAQYALLAPVARYFWRPPQVDDTRFPWSFGPAAEANFRTYAELRYRLLPYYTQLGWEAYTQGLPVMRPMLLEHPDDPRFADVTDQVLLGDRLLVAPVLAAADPATGAARRTVRLPAGAAWHDWWTAASHAGGGEIEYAAPLDRLPLLARGGTILLLGPALPFIPAGHRFDELEARCWPPFPAETVFRDDDGHTRAYQRGEFSTTRLAVAGSYEAGRVTFDVSAAEGGYAGQPAARRITLALERSPRPRAVTAAGQAGAAFEFDEAGQRVTVRLECPVGQGARCEVEY
jgi:alpha-glucosidase (family GH31 glycosyl hydrolase)